MNYIGLKCGICEKAFEEKDDVVVCPECGTPMHRACYKESGACPNEEKHGSGFVFDEYEKIKNSAQGKSAEPEPPVRKITLEKPAQSAASQSVCPICGTQNREKANFCDNCGTRLAKGIPLPTPNGEPVDYTDPRFFAAYAMGQNTGIPASTAFEDDVTAGDIACYVAINSPYYLGAFRRIKNGIGKFNVSAAVFSGVWFIYRKLYKVGALILSIEALLYVLKIYVVRGVSFDIMSKLLESAGIPTEQVSSMTSEQYMKLAGKMMELPFFDQLMVMLPTLIVIMQIALMIVCGVIANKLYYKRCLSGIKDVKEFAEENSLSRSEISKSLYLAGGVNAMLAGVLGMIYLFIMFL